MSSLYWYPWYPNRWMGSLSVRCMTLQERGAYVDLLNWQWQGKGYLPADTATLSKVTGFDVTLYPSVLAQFPVQPNGMRANATLLQIWDEQSSKHSRRQASGKKRWEKEEDRDREETQDKETDKEANAQAMHEQCSSNTLTGGDKGRDNPQSADEGTTLALTLDDTLVKREAEAQEAADFEATKNRIGQWFGRRPSTKWSPKELKALHELGCPPPSMNDLEAYYTARIPKAEDYRRRDIQTLLNNWNGEIDRAFRWQKSKPLVNCI